MVGDVPFYVQNADFQSIFARSVSAVTASEPKMNSIR